MVYEPPAPALIKEPISGSALTAHREFAFSSLPYFQWHVMGNDMQTCMDPSLCLKHDSHLHGKWNYHIKTYNSIYEACSRGHLKTTWTQTANAYDMTRYPMIGKKRSFTNLQVSYSKEQAIEWHTGLDGNGGLKGMLVHVSENLDLGLDFATSSKANIALKGVMPNGKHNSSASVGRSMGGSIRMKHTDRITLDDIINERMSMSIATAENILRSAIFGTRTPNLEGKNAQILYIGTVVEEGDPLDKIRNGEIAKGLFRGGEYTGIIADDIPIWDDYADEFIDIKSQMIESGEFYAIEDEMIKNGEFNVTQKMIELIIRRIKLPKPRVLWERKRPISYHLEQFDILGKLFYDKEYLLKTINEQLALFRHDWIERAKERGKDYKLRRTPAEGSIVTLGIDFAISISKSADYNVFFLTEFTKEGWEIPLDMIRFQGADLNYGKSEDFGKKGEVEDYIEYKLLSVMDEWQDYLSYTVAEEVGFQRMFGNTLRKAGRHVKEYNTGGEKHQAVIGIPGLDKPFRDNRFIIPWGNSYSVDEMSKFVHELKGWQLQIDKMEYKSKAKNDDTTIAWWMSRIARDHFQRGQYGYGTNTELDDPAMERIERQRKKKLAKSRRYRH
jgi:hypothetical protein